MPTSVGPNVFGEENLVFGYDLGDVVNSYKGEPTTNLIPSPERNARFTTDNSWYTYNTAQYNGNTYFSIGAVASVSDNEVTLSSVGRTIYTYDVLTPQTTGGGVTAGTYYMVKKTGTNKFTLHAYNGNQNGSQGYRDPATGAFKVHESVALDQRISINSTNFPTMWWGPPHQPNMCFVKEVVSSGGPNDNSSFMRIHLTRPAGTDGGMAYGVYPQVTQGDLITVSFWARSSVNSNWSWSTYFNAGFSAPSFGISSTTEWQRFQYTWTASNTFGFYMYFWPGNPGFVPYYVDLADIQVEVNKGHATSFTLSSRSNTQGLLDLTGNASISLSGVSFDSNGQMTFDGTDDIINIPAASWNILTTHTLEAVFKANGTGFSGYHVMFQKEGGYSGGAVYGLRAANAGGNLSAMICYDDQSASQNSLFSSTTVTNGQYYHVVATFDSGYNWKIYINGVLENETTLTGNPYQNSSPIYIGRGDSRTMNGDLPIAKIYNRVLTASEVESNFNAIKGRFNI